MDGRVEWLAALVVAAGADLDRHRAGAGERIEVDLRVLSAKASDHAFCLRLLGVAAVQELRFGDAHARRGDRDGTDADVAEREAAQHYMSGGGLNPCRAGQRDGIVAVDDDGTSCRAAATAEIDRDVGKG